MKDGLQGIPVDRWLMRIKDGLQILTTVGALIWGGMHVVQSFHDMQLQVSILQQQVSTLQGLVVDSRPRQRSATRQRE
jgi:hypothetical protein